MSLAISSRDCLMMSRCALSLSSILLVLVDCVHEGVLRDVEVFIVVDIPGFVILNIRMTGIQRRCCHAVDVQKEDCIDARAGPVSPARGSPVSELNLPHVHYRRDGAQNNSPSSPDRAPPVENRCLSARLHQRVHPSKLNLQRVCGFFSSYLHPVRHGGNLARLVPVPRAS